MRVADAIVRGLEAQAFDVQRPAAGVVLEGRQDAAGAVDVGAVGVSGVSGALEGQAARRAVLGKRPRPCRLDLGRA